MSVFAAQHLCSRIPLIAAIARLPGRGNVAQDRREPRDCGRVFDPFRESVLDWGARRIVWAGLPDGASLLVARDRSRVGGLLRAWVSAPESTRH